MDLLEEPDAEAKPERRANHRLQRSSDPGAELRAAGEADGDADSSDVISGSSDGDGHAAMDELLQSDDSMASEESRGADDDVDDAAAEGAVGGAGGDRHTPQQLPGQGKRKRAGPGAVGGGGEAGTGKPKNKKSKVDVPLAGLVVSEAKQVCSGKKGSKKTGGGSKTALKAAAHGSKKVGGDSTGSKQVMVENGVTGGKKVKQRVQKSNVTNGNVMDEEAGDKAPSVTVKLKTADAKGKGAARHGKANAAAGKSNPGKSKAVAGVQQATEVSEAGAKKSKSKGTKGRSAKG